MCIHNACDTESLCACCRRYGPDHDESVCAPINQQLRMDADIIRSQWRGNEPPLWNQSAWHHWKNEMRRVEVLERAAAEIEKLTMQRDDARREVCSMNETGLRMNDGDKRREAKRRGWDCFKEGKP